jgi:ribosomal protein L37AE/L43A
MKMTRWTKVGMAALGAGLVVWVALMLLSGGDTKLAPGKSDDEKHCPECGRELPRRIQEAGGECPFCKMEGKTVLVGRGAPKNSVWRGPAIPIAIASAFGLLLVVNLVFVVRNRRAANKEEELYYVNCRKCRRRLRYRERQAGQVAKCPACRAMILFPKLDAPRPRWPARLWGKLLRR